MPKPTLAKGSPRKGGKGQKRTTKRKKKQRRKQAVLPRTVRLDGFLSRDKSLSAIYSLHTTRGGPQRERLVAERHNDHAYFSAAGHSRFLMCTGQFEGATGRTLPPGKAYRVVVTIEFYPNVTLPKSKE